MFLDGNRSFPQFYPAKIPPHGNLWTEVRMLLRHGTHQLRQADEVVGRSREREHPAHLPGAAEAGLALPAQHQTTLP